MTTQEFLSYMNSGQEVIAFSDVHLKMTELSNEAMRITAELNNAYHSPVEIKALMEQLTGREFPEGAYIFPPFYTDCGKNLKIGKNVFINSCCQFQDQGGITIGDGTLVGPKTVIATLNHHQNPSKRANLIPKSVVIGKNVWIGANVTNITDDTFLCFGVKGLLDTNRRLKDAMLFNILSYMSNKLLGIGNTVASIDELYLFLSNRTAIEYIRNAMKRVRKKESSVILASQNIEDFLLPDIKEFTKPLFSIPTHHFLFYPGNINAKDYEEALMVEPNEYQLIRFSSQGTCLYRCGNERYLLQVIAPKCKSALFGKAGGR